MSLEIRIEDVYPLTPLQQGMLLHTLKSDHPGPYIEQFVFDVGLNCETSVLVAAWNEVIARHSVFRSWFVWEGVEEPHQVVAADVEIPIEEVDRAGLGDDEADLVVECFLDLDRERGINLDRPPPMRLTFFRFASHRTVVWTLHHLVMDGWSLPLILDEVATIYRSVMAAQCGGTAARVAEAAPQFRDYVGWLAGLDTAAAEHFWRARLANETDGAAAAGLELLPGYPGERRGTVSGSLGRHDLPKPLVDRIRAKARETGVTVGTVFQAAWTLMLARHAQVPVVRYGLTMASRPAELTGVMAMVGPLITTVPCQFAIEEAVSVAELLRTVQRHRLDAEPYRDVSLVDIATWHGEGRPDPLFETILVIENYPSDSFDYALGDGSSLVLRFFREDTGYPLTVVIFPRPDGVRVQVMFDPDRYESECITTLLGRYEVILRRLVSDLSAAVSAVIPLDTAEATRLTETLNDTASAMPVIPLHRRFEAQAALKPHAVAVDDHGSLISYRELDQRSSQRAAQLIGNGVGPDVVVGIMQRRSTEILVSILAIMKSGGAYVVLDPAHPDDRLAYILDDSRTRLVLCDGSLASRLPTGTPIIDIDVAAGVGSVTAVSQVQPNLEQLCYITYTSGSTGRPKGIMMTHGAVANLIEWQLTRDAAALPERTFAYASFSFDVSFQDMFVTWAAGGTLLLVREEERVDFDRLVDLARTQRVQRWFMPAVALEHVAATAWQRGTPIPDLTELIAGSEPLHVTPPVRWLLAGTRVRLENQYGPSECHVVTSWLAPDEPDAIPEAPPVGVPIANTRVYVLDSLLRPVPVGVTGNLFLAGLGMARGYIARPGLTADRFVPCPFGSERGARMYDTGDRARWRCDDQLDLLGRSDSQVKIRGFRVELGEVESVLREQVGVRDALVMVREHDGDRRLVGYVVTEGDPKAFDAQALVISARGILPDYMVPSWIVPLADYPLTVNRKIARDLLPAPATGTGFSESDQAGPPLTTDERRMIAMWCEVLGTTAVELDDDFFRIGGHSLTAMRLIGRVREAFDVPVGVGALFRLRTPRRLQAHVMEMLAQRSAAADQIPGEQHGTP